MRVPSALSVLKEQSPQKLISFASFKIGKRSKSDFSEMIQQNSSATKNEDSDDEITDGRETEIGTMMTEKILSSSLEESF